MEVCFKQAIIGLFSFLTVSDVFLFLVSYRHYKQSAVHLSDLIPLLSIVTSHVKKVFNFLWKCSEFS